jgi:hypothetical protein
MDVVGVHWDSNRPLALVVMESEQGHALVWLRLQANSGPLPIEVVFRGGDAPSERRSRAMLRDYRPPKIGSVSSSMLRAVSLSEALNAVGENVWQPDSFYSRLTRVDGALITSAYDRFRSVRDRDAAVEWVNVAAAFVSRVHSGDMAPAKSLAEELGKPVAWVNKRLAAARQAGYLTSLGHGRTGGELTDEAFALLQRVAQDDVLAQLNDFSGEDVGIESMRSTAEIHRHQGRVEVCVWCMHVFIHDGQQGECPNCDNEL